MACRWVLIRNKRTFSLAKRRLTAYPFLWALTPKPATPQIPPPQLSIPNPKHESILNPKSNSEHTRLAAYPFLWARHQYDLEFEWDVLELADPGLNPKPETLIT